MSGNSMQTAGPKDEFGKSHRLAELQVCPCVSENVNRMIPGKKWDGRVHTARDALFGKPGKPTARPSCCLVATAYSLSPPPPINSEHSSVPWESPHPLYRSTHFPQVVLTMTWSRSKARPPSPFLTGKRGGFTRKIQGTHYLPPRSLPSRFWMEGEGLTNPQPA